jgi:hypothetical protein
MPAFAFPEQKLYCGRYKELRASLYEIDEATDVATPVAITALDVPRAKLSASEGALPSLDLSTDPTEELTGGSKIEIITLGTVGNPDPDDDEPAQLKIIFEHEDTKTLADAWGATQQRKRYWLDLSLFDAADGRLKPFGRGQVMVHRSPGGNLGA